MLSVNAAALDDSAVVTREAVLVAAIREPAVFATVCLDVTGLVDATTEVFEGLEVSLLAVVVSMLVEGKALLV